MGACGTGMGALAGMLKSIGYHVSGSDAQVYPPMSDFLVSQGIAINAGYGPQNLSPGPDLVVVGNVITKNNPEAEALARLALPYVSLPQALRHFFLSEKTSLVMSGTHGKTTCSSLLATLLDAAGHTPGFMIGGIVQAFGRNFNVNSGKYFVVEGDEYDTAFFDKGPKFLHYQPKIAVITSIEFDHADIYPDLATIKRSFAKLVEIVPEDGCIIAHLDDPVVMEVVGAAKCAVLGYGVSHGLSWQLAKITVTPDGTFFSVNKEGNFYGNFISRIPGRHNALNSLAVIAVLDQLGIDEERIAKGLQGFQGVKRRQEVRGVKRGITVIDDFAHHPTSVRETLGALKAAYDGHRLIAVFEPRTNSSRRRIFQEAYAGAFGAADRVVVKEPDPLQNIAEQERFSSNRLVHDLCEKSVDAHYFADTDSILDYLVENAMEGDVIAILSNGSFDNIHQKLLDLL